MDRAALGKVLDHLGQGQPRHVQPVVAALAGAALGRRVQSGGLGREPVREAARRRARAEAGSPACGFGQRRHEDAVAAGADQVRQRSGQHRIGKAAIAYLPRNKVVGISKLARVLHGYARRLQIQERLTAEVAQCIWDHLDPHGVAVVIEAQHGCMTGRGVKTPGVGMITSRILGCFLDNDSSRKEVMSLMGY